MLRCLSCNASIDAGRFADDPIVCASCGFEYLKFDGRIPLFDLEWKAHIAASHQEFVGLRDENEKLLKQVADAKDLQPERAELLDRVSLALTADNTFYQNLIDAHARYVTEREIVELKHAGQLPAHYSLDEGIAFFHRDWCRSHEAEKEIATIVDAVKVQVRAHAADVETLLVPGAGAGRFAAELSSVFETTVALDALHMGAIFYDLLQADRILSEVRLHRGVAKREDVVTLNHLSPGPDIRSRVEDGTLSYWVGSALDAPLPDASLSCIACIYFIDVVPPQKFVTEAHRLLKPGGLFVNVGPLCYPRGDVSVMLCGEELAALYERSGFEILNIDTLPNTQLASASRITSVMSNNLTFTARKRESLISASNR